MLVKESRGFPSPLGKKPLEGSDHPTSSDSCVCGIVGAASKTDGRARGGDANREMGQDGASEEGTPGTDGKMHLEWGKEVPD